MERQYLTRKPTDLEVEKYTYIEKDEKDIPLGTFEPFEILEYRGYAIPIYADDYGQEFFIRFNDEEWANPNCYYEDFCDFIDDRLDYLIPSKTPNQISQELNSIKIFKISPEEYLKYKNIQRDINKYLHIFSYLVELISIKENNISTQGSKYIVKTKEGIFIDDIILDQLKRVVEKCSQL